MFTRFAASARNFLHAEDGAVAIQLALSMVVLIGMGALAIDVGYALSKQRQMQSAADAAAFSAAVAKSTGHPAEHGGLRGRGRERLRQRLQWRRRYLQSNAGKPAGHRG